MGYTCQRDGVVKGIAMANTSGKNLIQSGQKWALLMWFLTGTDGIAAVK